MKKQANTEITDANLSLEEIENLAEEITTILLRGKGVTIDRYKQIAQKISPKDLGHRRFKALKYEAALEEYLPTEVYEILKERANKQQYGCFNDDDIEFMKSNGGKGIRWIADHLYANSRDIAVKMKEFHILYKEKHHAYRKNEKEFIRANIDKGLKWLSTQTNYEVGPLRKLAIRIGIEKNRIRSNPVVKI